MSPNPNQSIIAQETSKSEGLNDLEHNLIRKKLSAGETQTLRPYENIDADVDYDEGVYQYLRGIIKAGNSFFSIVDSRVQNKFKQPDKPDSYITTFVTRYKPGEPAEIIGSVEDGKVLTIGRSAQRGALSDDPKISRNHFKISVEDSADGSTIEVTDAGSTNGTVVLTMSPDALQSGNVEPSFWTADPTHLQEALFGKQPS